MSESLHSTSLSEPPVTTMKTACPHCQTVFAVTEAQLSAADGQVSCGVCQQVFTATVQDDLFVAGTPAMAGSQSAANAADADATPAQFEQHDAPGQERLDDDSHDLFSGTDGTVVPEELRDDRSGTGSRRGELLWALGCALLVTALALQFAWTQRHQLVQSTALQPAVSWLCMRIDCKHLALRDPGSLEMLSRNVYTHPNAEDALMVALTLVNRADFAQGWPDIRIDFSDVVGSVIASRRFTPQEYLASDDSAARSLLPNAPVSFNIEIVDPGDRALTYEFSFL